MAPFAEIRNTLMACQHRIRGTAIFLEQFKECLLREANQDASVKALIQEISADSAALAVKVEALLKKMPAAQTPAEAATNRRREERFAAEGEATVIVNATNKKTYLLKNVSSGGLGIIGSHALKSGDKVDVVVLSPCLKNSVYEGATVCWGNKVDEKLWAGGITLQARG